MELTLPNFLSVLGGLGLTATVFAAAIYAVFRLFGEKWLTSKFDERLSDYKHAQQRELESLRLQINSMLDRAVKLNDHEFKVLPKIWSMLNEAHGEVARFTSPLQQYPNVGAMKQAELKDFVENLEIREFEKHEIMFSHDKDKKYQDIIFWKKLNQTNSVFVDFNNFYITNSIFVDDEIKAIIDIERDLLSDALREARNEREYNDPRLGRFKKRDELMDVGRTHLDSIDVVLRKRLWQNFDDDTSTRPEKGNC